MYILEIFNLRLYQYVKVQEMPATLMYMMKKHYELHQLICIIESLQIFKEILLSSNRPIVITNYKYMNYKIIVFNQINKILTNLKM